MEEEIDTIMQNVQAEGQTGLPSIDDLQNLTNRMNNNQDDAEDDDAK